ncbi:MAG: hypothetical protein R3F59_18265 [Myxococcota bacterium]
MMAWWTRMRERYEALVEEYGWAAIATYAVLFVGTLIGFYAAMRAGYSVEGTAGSAGTIGAAYFATKMTQPLRIAATLGLTPVMVRVIRFVRPTRAPQAP